MPIKTKKNTIETTHYGLMDRKTGKRIRIQSSYTCNDSSSSFYGQSDYELTTDEEDPLFEVKDLVELRRVLSYSPQSWFSHSREHPGWKDFKREDLIPVVIKRTETITTIPVEELKLPIEVPELCDTRSIGYKQACAIVGRQLKEKNPVVMVCKASKPREYFEALIGKQVIRNVTESYGSWRTVIAIIDLPSMNKDLGEILLLASEMQYS